MLCAYACPLRGPVSAEGIKHVSSPASSSSSPRGLILLLSAAVGIAVANIYYAQPLAAAIARDLHVADAQVGTAMTLTQVGYALGMILLVPLGDGRERRSMIVATAASSVLALLLVARAGSMLTLTVASLLVGVATSVVQMILPYAVALVPAEQRGHAIGSVMAGLLSGILLSRTASGAIGAALGWRAMYVIAACVMALLTLILRLALPRQEPTEPLSLGEILRSLARVFTSEPTIRKRALVGALGMASFSLFWSTMSFQLARLGHGSAVAGMFGAIGVVGVFVAPVAGKLAVGPAPSRLNLLGLGVAALSFVVFLVGARSLVAMGVGVVLLDAGVQASHLTNQTVIFGLAPELRNRLNALYMVSYFVGGAAGTFAGAMAWSLAGWPAVCALGALFSLLGVLPILGELRPALAAPH